MAAAPGGEHRRHERVDHVDGTHQVHLHLCAPVVELKVLHPAPGGDARDVGDDAHRPVIGVHLVGPRHHGIGIAHIQRAAREHGTALGLDLLHDGGQRLCLDIREHEPHPARAAASAVARPMPLAAPVISMGPFASEVMGTW